MTETDRIERYLREAGHDPGRARIVPLTGDASDRRYFRIFTGAGASFVLALQSGPVEFATSPFAQVAELFGQMGLPVPAILGHSNELGIMALQDLGDLTLQAHLGAAPATEHAALYRQAVAFIEQLQRLGAELKSDRWVPYQVAFDVEKLTWELNFFVKHFLVAYRGVSLTDAEMASLSAEWEAIARELANEPRTLCHRDYHSRNLMLSGDSLYIIDFQDARMGPDTYDLASLLRDSYVDLTEREVDELIAYFLAMKGCLGDVDTMEFRRRFDLMALQRNLKALGTFGFQTTSRRNPVYIQYIPRTLGNVRKNLEKYARFARLGDLLARHIVEWSQGPGAVP